MAEPFSKSNPVLVCEVRSGVQPFYAKSGREAAGVSAPCASMEGQNREGTQTMPAALPLQTTH